MEIKSIWINSAKVTQAVTLVFSLWLGSSVTVAQSKSGFDTCFEKSLSGERIEIPCPTGPQAMTDAEIAESLEQFRAFEKSDIVEEVFEAARKREAEPPRKKSPYMKKITAKEINQQKTLTPEESSQQELAKQKAHQEYIQEGLKRKKESKLRPEIKSKVGSIVNGKYRVSLYFINNADFPKKHTRHAVFRENTTEAFAKDWEQIIFKHYLKDDYQQYVPELGVVGEFVGMTIFVDSSDELESIIKGQPIEFITHIGTPLDKNPGIVIPVTRINKK